MHWSEFCFVFCKEDFSSGSGKTVLTYLASGFFVACRTPKAIAPTLAVPTMTIRGAIWKGNKTKMKQNRREPRHVFMIFVKKWRSKKSWNVNRNFWPKFPRIDLWEARVHEEFNIYCYCLDENVFFYGIKMHKTYPPVGLCQLDVLRSRTH